MKKVIVTVGCRPDCIKMMPLVKELKKRKDEWPDYDLEIMKPGQSLFDITSNILGKIQKALEEIKPDVVLVHGDTSTAFVTALACYYMQIPIEQIEVG